MPISRHTSSRALTARIARPLAAGASLALLLTGCGALSEANDDEGAKDQVVAAFYPLQYVTQRVAGDAYDVENLTAAGNEPHDLELTIRETAQLSDAALVVHLHGFQPAVDSAVDNNASGEVLDVAEVVDLLPATGDHDHAEEEGHAEEEAHADEHADEEAHADEGDTDPHFWLDPVRMADLADTLATSLGEVAPDLAGDFEENAAALRTELEELDQEYADGLSDCQRDIVVVSHNAFGYLGKYGLEFEPIAGLSPGAEPTPADLQHLQQVVEDEGITTVFSETLVSPKLANSLADDLGIETDVLDPVEGLSDETAGEDYLSLMRSNLSALMKANGC